MVAKGWPEALCAVIYIFEYDLKKKRNNELVVNAEGSEDMNSQDVKKDENHWFYLESSRSREISLTEDCVRLNRFWRSWEVRKKHVLSQVGISGSGDGETSKDILNSEQDGGVCSFLTGGPVSLFAPT